MKVAHFTYLMGLGVLGDFVDRAFSFTYGYGRLGHKVGGDPEFDGWPRWDSVTHQSVYEDWLNELAGEGSGEWLCWQ